MYIEDRVKNCCPRNCKDNHPGCECDMWIGVKIDCEYECELCKKPSQTMIGEYDGKMWIGLKMWILMVWMLSKCEYWWFECD